MKLKLFIFATLISFVTNNAVAASINDKNQGLRFITSYGKVRCGADMSTKGFAYRDDDGYWRGIAADLCQIIAKATLNRSDAFEMIDTNEDNMEKSLATGKIDVMLGAPPLNASRDYSSKISKAGLITYDKQAILVKKIDEAKSLEDYKDQRMCVVGNSFDFYNIQNYIEKYDLGIKLLLTKDRKQSQDAFLLKRCSMITGERIYLSSLWQNSLGAKDIYEIIPEYVALKPLYAYVDKDNQKLRATVEWVINALKLAEENEITSQNIDIIIGSKDPSLQNLLGDNDKIWKDFQLSNASWVREAIKEYGNYGEIFDRNLGKASSFKFEREDNRLFKKGGLITPQPFL